MSQSTSSPSSEDEKPLSPEQERIFARVRWLMLLSGLATFLGIAVVIGIIGYRVFKSEGSSVPAEVTAQLPRGAMIISTAVAEDRLVITLDVRGIIEIRTFDVKSLRPTGRLKFANEP
jgi:hypothetical protein